MQIRQARPADEAALRRIDGRYVDDVLMARDLTAG